MQQIRYTDGVGRNRTNERKVTLANRLEYSAVRLLLGGLGVLPRNVARRVGVGVAMLARPLLGRLNQYGRQNLKIAFPELSETETLGLMREQYRSLGRLMAEFAQMSGYSASRVTGEVMRYDGLEHYLAARDKGRGVLVLTGHLGAWELSSFVHSLLGYPMGMVIRRLDNPLVDDLVNGIRCMHGNRILHKDDFARGLLRAMHAGETVGILMDTNMTPPQGLFVPFFGKQACTASGLARVARKTGAAVIPGFLLWNEDESRYVLHFGAELDLQHTDDAEADALANTAMFARVTEGYVRQYPGQWLWLHRRWKTRPPGEAPLYVRHPGRRTAERTAS